MATKRTTIIELEPTSDGKKAPIMENICLEPIDADVKPSQWLGIFNKLASLINQDESRGEKVVHLKDLKKYMRWTSSYQIEYETGMSKDQLLSLTNKLKKADKNQDGSITLHEWEDWVQATQSKPTKKIKNDKLNKAMNLVAYSPTWTCTPPTIFIILMSFLQVLFYLLQTYAPESLGMSSAKALHDSYFIYHYRKKSEIWRFVTYIFVHAGPGHIINNILLQLIVGIPLEMSQPGWKGTGRVAVLYFCGILFGILGATAIDPEHKYVCGASAGVYALVWAHLASLIMNWKEDGLMHQKRQKDGSEEPLHLNKFIRGARVALLILWLGIDVITTLFYADENVSIEGHAFGGIAGVLVGTFILHNRKVEDWERLFKIVTLSIFGITSIVFILNHISIY